MLGAPYQNGFVRNEYAVTADGQRFLINEPVEGTAAYADPDARELAGLLTIPRSTTRRLAAGRARRVRRSLETGPSGPRPPRHPRWARASAATRPAVTSPSTTPYTAGPQELCPTPAAPHSIIFRTNAAPGPGANAPPWTGANHRPVTS